jgi:hypothetical protein
MATTMFIIIHMVIHIIIPLTTIPDITAGLRFHHIPHYRLILKPDLYFQMETGAFCIMVNLQSGWHML